MPRAELCPWPEIADCSQSVLWWWNARVLQPRLMLDGLLGMLGQLGVPWMTWL